MQTPVHPVDEYGALVYAGRWGIHGISLSGRLTFAPGNAGFFTFIAPRPMEVGIYPTVKFKLLNASPKLINALPWGFDFTMRRPRSSVMKPGSLSTTFGTKEYKKFLKKFPWRLKKTQKDHNSCGLTTSSKI